MAVAKTRKRPSAVKSRAAKVQVKETAPQAQILQFKIQQLRLDKLIFSVDAVAVCFAVFLILLSLPILYAYVPNLPPQTSLVLLIVAVLSVIVALSGNFGRWMKIRQLENTLRNEK